MNLAFTKLLTPSRVAGHVLHNVRGSKYRVIDDQRQVERA